MRADVFCLCSRITAYAIVYCVLLFLMAFYGSKEGFVPSVRTDLWKTEGY
jgi:hypothetical protein